jgi:hypothetical protein
MEADAPKRGGGTPKGGGAGADSATARKRVRSTKRRAGSPKYVFKKINYSKKWFITDFWNLIKEQQPQGGLTIDSRWL